MHVTNDEVMVPGCALSCVMDTWRQIAKMTNINTKLRHIDCRQAWVEALRDEHIVKLIKVDTTENLADLNSKLLNVVRFEYLVNKIMVRKELPTPKAAASMNP